MTCSTHSICAGNPRPALLSRTTRLLPLVLAVLAARSGSALDPRNVEPGEAVGEFVLDDIRGQRVSTSDWKGKPSVWLYVSPDQRSSELAIRELQAQCDRLGGADIRAVILTSDGGKAPYFRLLVEKNKISIPVVVDARREVYGRLGVIVFPTTFLVDSGGKLHRTLTGHDLAYAHKLNAHLAFLTGRVSREQLERDLTDAVPAGDPARERAERFLRSAEIMLERGLTSEAQAALRSAVAADPRYLEARVRLVELLARSGEDEEAEKLVRRGKEDDSQGFPAELCLGVIRLHQERLDDAERLLRIAIKSATERPRTHYWLGRLYERRGEHGRAAQEYRAALEALVPALAAPGR